ncbi:class I SAM-dependent methyltransferase [Butyrivibrio fibrisolvens]|uniref:class I SAM-dependent methyltransferase n=1 Tax=Butyrivibrio fibrisolvens TaxID=831 RepID=UPI00040E7DCA|nr:class I SAM-dependent methyltransferase [Butyrivibrio fibrisolvens]
METLEYYDQNADSFINGTRDVDFSKTQNMFMELIPKDGRILDFGCGSGRDTKCFLDHGFKVEAIDGSKEICKIASDYTGIPVKHMYFQDLDESEKYDGIWACASILHVSKDELSDVLRKMAAALKSGGVIYTSFKYGDFEGVRNGRFFTDLTEESFSELISVVSSIVIEKTWVTSDVRPDRGEEKWLNLILRKG